MNDVETFGAMAEALEHVSNLITRYAIFENLYLHIGSAVEDQLADALHYQKLDEKWRKECFKSKLKNFLLHGRDVNPSYTTRSTAAATFRATSHFFFSALILTLLPTARLFSRTSVRSIPRVPGCQPSLRAHGGSKIHQF